MGKSFNENFKYLRKKNNFTQEKVAELLGVTSQAVSKWETATTYPDISVLPIISKLFGISIDYLLGVDVSERETEIADVLKKADEYGENNEYVNAVQILREASIQYPAHPKIMYRLAWYLTGTIREYPENLYESISLLKKILELSDDTELRAKATRDLMYRYSTADDEKTALTYAKKLPSFEVCKEYNLGRSNLLYGKVLAEYLMSNIRLYANAMHECLEYFQDTVILKEEEMHPYTVESAKEKISLLDQIIG